MRKFGILIVLLALVIGMAGCVISIPGSTVQYTVKISSAVGGIVSEPGEGLFRYPAGEVIELVADPEIGYEFAGWVTNADIIADVHNATTTLTLNKDYYFVIATFSD